MPELPDITIYVEALATRIVGETLLAANVMSPFLIRTVQPPLSAAVGRRVREIRRLGKKIAIGFDSDTWVVLHLMIAGRLHWKPPSTQPTGKHQLAALEFPRGTLLLSEAGSKRRAALYVAQGADQLSALNPGGLEVLTASCDEFAGVLRSRNHTLKRALTDPRLFSGIGNSYSDEILHRARQSPFALSGKLSAGAIDQLYDAARTVLGEWIERLRAEADGEFPENVTAFRAGMAAHGRCGKACPVCGTPIQRIRYADNETNYCPTCQTDGKIYSDRSLARLLKDAWPKHVDEL